MRFWLILISILAFSGAKGSTEPCFPVPFDHFYFRVDKATYEQMGRSSYFADDHFSFFEPNKSPWGTHYGHYITGGVHHLEVFEEAMPTTPEPLGIAFLSERVGCLQKIHETLSALGRPFVMQPDAEWGSFSQLEKNKTFAVWVAELKPDYVKAPDGAIDRASWLRRIREMNKDPFKGDHNFRKIKKVIWRLLPEDAAYLARIFKALGWTEQPDGTLSHDETAVVLESTKTVAPTQSLKSLTFELKTPYRGTKLGNLETKPNKRPPELTVNLK